MKKQTASIARAKKEYKSLISFETVSNCVKYCDGNTDSLYSVVVKHAKKYNLI